MSSFFPDEVVARVFLTISGALLFTYNEMLTSDDTTFESPSLAQEIIPMTLFLTILPAVFAYDSQYTTWLLPFPTAMTAAGSVAAVARHTEETLSLEDRMALTLFFAFILEGGQLAIKSTLRKIEELVTRKEPTGP